MILSYTSWSGATQRGWIHAEDRLTRYLMASPRVRRLLVCNPFRSAPIKLLRRLAGQVDAPFPETPERRLHEPLRVRRYDPTGAGAIRRSVSAYERGVRRAAEHAGLETPVVVSSHPLVAGHGSFDWAGPVTYYANDDLTAQPPLRPWWPAFADAFERLCASGRGAVGLTPRALESIGPAERAAVIPCGLEPDEWTAPGPAPAWFTALPGPRLLYVGTLDARVDVEQVRAAAAARPRGSVVLVGPCLDEGHYAPLRSVPNVVVHPAIERAELAGLVAAADAGLIPHVRSAQTEAMSPLKLFEYLAAGLPVAAVDLPGIAGVCPERTVLTGADGDFGAAVEQALGLGAWTPEARADFIAECSWERRFDRLLDVALIG